MAAAICTVCLWQRETGRTVDTSISNVAWGAKIGVSEASVRRHLAHPPEKELPEDPVQATYKFEQGADDFSGNSEASEIPQSVEDVEGFIRAKGMNPADWDYTWRFSEWQAQKKGGLIVTLHAFKVSGRRKPIEASALVDSETVIERIRNFHFIPEVKATSPETLVVVPADLQIGKTDWNGGTEETIEQALASFHRVAEIARELRPAQIVMADAGDPIENIYSTSSQLGTNDRSLPWQIEAASHVFLSGIELLAPLTEKFDYLAVSSNHGAHRIGPKSPAGDVHDDYGIVIARMIGRALRINPAAFGHVSVTVPEPYHESLAFETEYGTTLGLVHGHQAGSADKIGEWWKGQSHGHMPIARARVLIAGHFHSFRVSQSGDARWLLIGPSSDRGSSWFTNSKGESSTSGMMVFTTRDNQFGMWPQVV